MLLSDVRTKWTVIEDAQFARQLQAFSSLLGSTRISALEAESRLPLAAWESLREEWNGLPVNSILSEIIAAVYRSLDSNGFQNDPSKLVLLAGRMPTQFGHSAPACFFRVIKSRSPRARRIAKDSDDFAGKDRALLAAEDEFRDPDCSWAFRFSPIWCTWSQVPPMDIPPFLSVSDANDRLALDIDPATITSTSHLVLSYGVHSISALLIPTLADAVRPGANGSHSWHRYFHPTPAGAQWGETRPSQPHLSGLPEAVHDKSAAINVAVAS